MSESKEKYEKKIKEDLRRIYSEYRIIEEKENLDDNDLKKMEDIVKTLKHIEPQKSIVKELSNVEILKMTKLSNIINELKSVFTYDLKTPNNFPIAPSKRKNINEGNNLIIKNFTSGNIANRNTFGINDDVTNFVNDPIFSVERQLGNKPNGGFIHSLIDKINSEYKITFSFTLNRFPSKTYQNSFNQNSMKQLTSRRTDLIKFNYENSIIEFGAMAPMGVFFDSQYRYENLGTKNYFDISHLGLKRGMTFRKLYKPLVYKPYDQKYSEFSIACCIHSNTTNGHTMSFSTDYKFELGKNYVVTLTISKINENQFGFGDEYQIKMDINGVTEPTTIYNGKVWNKKGNKAKDNNIVPSQPNFKYRVLPKLNTNFDGDVKQVIDETKKIELDIKNIYTSNDIYNQHNIVLWGLNINNLRSIITVPYKENGKNIYNKKTYKVNRGVSFKTVDIFYK